MYSRRIINENLEAFAAKHGWMPVYHTFAEIQDFSKYIQSIIEVKSNSKFVDIKIIKPLTQERAKFIRRWIENEQVLCALDYHYWESNYAYVIDEKGYEFKFKNRKSQEVFDSVIADFDDREVAIQSLIGKGRQVGITTKCALYFIQRSLFIPNTLSVMASVQREKSAEIMVKIDTAYEKCPFWLIPQRLTKATFENGSRISVESGMQPKGIAQGKTPTCCLISEVGLIPNPKNVIEEGLLPAVHPSRNLFMIFEGTGSGNVGWFP